MIEKHNGWTNYATWRVNLEMIDGINPRDLSVLDVTDVHQVADNLRDYCEQCLAAGSRNHITLSYALTFLEGVNWCEIAENLLNAYEIN